MRPTLVITRGLPASGKTTWAKAWVQEDVEHRARVNRDDLRLNLFGKPAPLSYQHEQAITTAQNAAVRALLQAGRSVVVDDTHLRHKYVKAWQSLALELGVDFALHAEFLEVPLEECIKRDKLRRRAISPSGGWFPDGYVGEDVIRDMHRRFESQAPAIDPVEEDFNSPYRYEPPLGRPLAWMVDIDGTLALRGDRSPFDWYRVGEDEVNWPVHSFVEQAQAANVFIVLISGRDECCREQTEAWLDTWNVPWDRLYMRPEGDTRKDSIVKLELFREHVAEKWQIIGVLDDRNQVVEMWRSIGIACFQVAEGNF